MLLPSRKKHGSFIQVNFEQNKEKRVELKEKREKDISGIR
jgi:hypothetical protein